LQQAFYLNKHANYGSNDYNGNQGQYFCTAIRNHIATRHGFNRIFISGKKIFLTKINVPEGFDNEEFINDLLKHIMDIAYERKLKVMPILPKIATFFRKHPTYKDLLPPGIKL
jgi:predicted GNAT family acetyltransferase